MTESELLISRSSLLPASDSDPNSSLKRENHQPYQRFGQSKPVKKTDGSKASDAYIIHIFLLTTDIQSCVLSIGFAPRRRLQKEVAMET
jgi:hypothetical protein